MKLKDLLAKVTSRDNIIITLISSSSTSFNGYDEKTLYNYGVTIEIKKHIQDKYINEEIKSICMRLIGGHFLALIVTIEVNGTHLYNLPNLPY